MAIRDLSHTLHPGMPTFPGDPAVSIEPQATLEADGYAVSALHLGSHSGTHIDAPAHTEPQGATLEALPIERFRFEAQLVDCTGASPNSEIGTGVLPEPSSADLLVVQTGWDAYWGDDRYFEHPYLSPAIGQWCAKHEYSVALDTLSPDPMPTTAATDSGSDTAPVHHHILGADHFIIENLTNLDGLPDRFVLLACPLAIRGGDGSPIRAVAVTEVGRI